MKLPTRSVKAAPMGIEDRTVTGIFAVHGNVDSGDGWSTRDRSHPGVFGDYTAEGGRSRVVFLWQHRSDEPPIATVDRLFEVDAADLPAAVKLYAPEATGGTAVVRTYLDTARGNEVLGAIKAGALAEMSYSYEVTKWDIEKPENDRDIPIRNIHKAKLYDVSDVNWGMNPATSADGTKGLSLVTAGAEVEASAAAMLAQARQLLDRRAKEGRTFSAANLDTLEKTAASLDDLAETIRALIKQADPKSAQGVMQLYLDYQRTIAQLQGVKIQ